MKHTRQTISALTQSQQPKAITTSESTRQTMTTREKLLYLSIGAAHFHFKSNETNVLPGFLPCQRAARGRAEFVGVALRRMWFRPKFCHFNIHEPCNFCAHEPTLLNFKAKIPISDRRLGTPYFQKMLSRYSSTAWRRSRCPLWPFEYMKISKRTVCA